MHVVGFPQRFIDSKACKSARSLCSNIDNFGANHTCVVVCTFGLVNNVQVNMFN